MVDIVTGTRLGLPEFERNCTANCFHGQEAMNDKQQQQMKWFYLLKTILDSERDEKVMRKIAKYLFTWDKDRERWKTGRGSKKRCRRRSGTVAGCWKSPIIFSHILLWIFLFYFLCQRKMVHKVWEPHDRASHTKQIGAVLSHCKRCSWPELLSHCSFCFILFYSITALKVKHPLLVVLLINSLHFPWLVVWVQLNFHLIDC